MQQPCCVAIRRHLLLASGDQVANSATLGGGKSGLGVAQQGEGLGKPALAYPDYSQVNQCFLIVFIEFQCPLVACFGLFGGAGGYLCRSPIIPALAGFLLRQRFGKQSSCLARLPPAEPRHCLGMLLVVVHGLIVSAPALFPRPGKNCRLQGKPSAC